MYDPKFELVSFQTLPAEAKMEVICKLLDVLIEADLAYLRAVPGIPLLYDAGVRYKEEELGKDMWQDIPRTLELKTGDCFPQGTLLLRDDMTLVPVEDIARGECIWGRDGWSTVEARVYKGVLSADAVVLNNGSTVCLTGDHHFFVGRCPDHRPELDDGYGCSCRLESRRIERVRLRDLRPKDVLVVPDRISFGRDASLSPDRALVEGLYVSDGWSEAYRFAISGKDGGPKESQKREVERICAELGVATRWDRRYIAVNDSKWAERMVLMGCHAPEKHLLSIDLAEAQAAATLRGVMADSNIASGGNANGGWTFTTTSRTLATQTRLLHKMFGRDCSIAYIEHHGGLGKNPIWRLGVRAPSAKGKKLLRVRSIERDVFESPCWDIQTSDHYVYLPEHDVTVSNCEDLASWRVAELLFAGEPARHVVEHRRSPNLVLYHIKVIRGDGTIEDPSAALGMPGGHLGRHPPFATTQTGQEIPLRKHPLVGVYGGLVPQRRYLAG